MRQNDAKQWAQWGIDFLNYDWGPVELPESRDMSDALRASGRDIFFSISNNSSNNILSEVADLSKVTNSWRTTTDITDSWNSVVANGFKADAWAPYAGPGHWNDPTCSWSATSAGASRTRAGSHPMSNIPTSACGA